MLDVILTGAISFIVTFLAIPAIMKVAREKKLYDLPDARKLHTKPIASLGGVGIFIGVFLSLLLTVPGSANTGLQFVFASAMVIFFLGVKDDILILSPTKKFLGQLAAAAIIVHLGNIRIESMHGILGVEKLPELVGYILSYATIIVVVNAYNLIDGVDGLAASLGIVTMGIFGTYFFMAGMTLFSLMAFAMLGGLIAFLFFNYHPARIFMGDSGSLLLGLMNAILVIKFMAVADSTTAAIPLSSSVAIGFAILILPLLDTLRVFSIRIARGRSPFSPDRNHIHHLLLDRGLNHRYVTLSCVGLNCAFIVMAYLGRTLGPTILISMMTLVTYGLIGMLFYLVKPARTLVITRNFHHSASEPSVQPATKVVSIKNEVAVAEQ
jgi:UDP-N-acetylmuramyl pentapeptide phosphotransferase/UDP-N-acetylglucosamine-1-phosphate transferase